MSIRTTHHVTELGNPDGPTMLLAHGFGCDQGMWRFMVPLLQDDFRLVLFDHMGLGESDLDAYIPEEYASLDGYATDVLAICDELGLQDVIFVGHSVSSMIGTIAARRIPEQFSKLVMICPSPRYIDDPQAGYVGGFSEADIDEMLATLSSNYLGWSAAMAPVVMGRPDRPELGQDLAAKFCQAPPQILEQFARVTFLSDNRADLPHVDVPTLVLETSPDAIAPEGVGAYVAEHLPQATLVRLGVAGHCPNLSAPEETAAAIKAWA